MIQQSSRAAQLRAHIGQSRVARAPGGVGQSRVARNPVNRNPIPWNRAYEQAVGDARKGFADTKAGLRQRRFSTLQSYGLNKGFNNAATNPYSRAAQLQKSYQQAQNANTNTAAASGQLYAGSYQNARNASLSDYNQRYDALAKEQWAELADIKSERLGARQELTGTITDARFQAALDATEQDPEAQASPRNRRKNRGNDRNNRGNQRRHQIHDRVRGANRNRGIR